jgi:hypothetical protein
VARRTGSTFRALADRGLIDIQEREYNVHGQAKPYIRVTTAGRRFVRSWTEQKAYKPPPAGTLREWHWRALALAYAVDDEGLEGRYGGDYAQIGWSTWLRLRDCKSSALVEERAINPDWHPSWQRTYRMYITAAGRELYEREWARYCELYPEVEAPPPAPHWHAV